ncbi:MAG: response regulator [Acidimicrobiales bacterium]
MTTIPAERPIVMVDDDAVDTELMSICVERSVLTNPFLSFDSGNSFLAHMESVRDGKQAMPAIVFLDINMPTMDGFAVLNELRAHPEFTALPVVVFLSNSDNPADVARCEELAAGFREKFERIADCVSYLDRMAPAV